MTDERDDELLRGQPHGRKGRSGHLIGAGGKHYRRPGGGQATLARNLRIAQRRPQAVLKITRYGHGGAKILDHIHYVRRHGKLALEDENGQRIEDVRELRRRVRLWTEQAGATMAEPGAEITRKRRVTAHFILDAGEHADRDALRKSVREFLAERFGKEGHEYLFARHDDTKQPHVHVVLNMMDGQGRRLHTSVAEVQHWREQFAEVARANGIEVDASRAWERGKATKATTAERNVSIEMARRRSLKCFAKIPTQTRPSLLNARIWFGRSTMSRSIKETMRFMTPLVAI